MMRITGLSPITAHFKSVIFMRVTIGPARRGDAQVAARSQV
jgi:hypothetical protein